MSAPDSLRVFLAIELTPDVRAALARAQEKLRRTGARVIWTAEANLHLTLFFLGNITRSRVERVCAMADARLDGHDSFTLQIVGLGAFGSPHRPRVLWAGVDSPPPALFALHAALREGLETLGFEPERRAWSPHITLGRVRGPQQVAELTSHLHKATTTDFGCAPVGRVAVMQSHLRAQGPHYELLHAVPLKGV